MPKFARSPGTFRRQLGLILTCALNVFVFYGTAELTTSARAYAEGWKRLERFIDWLFGQPGHCRGAWRNDMRRAAELLEKGQGID